MLLGHKHCRLVACIVAVEPQTGPAHGGELTTDTGVVGGSRYLLESKEVGSYCVIPRLPEESGYRFLHTGIG